MNHRAWCIQVYTWVRLGFLRASRLWHRWQDFFFGTQKWNWSFQPGASFAMFRHQGDDWRWVAGPVQHLQEAVWLATGLTWLAASYPRCSMYGIFTYIYPKNDPNVGKYSIHGASGYMIQIWPKLTPRWIDVLKTKRFWGTSSATLRARPARA